jgi:hypothetical protein
MLTITHRPWAAVLAGLAVLALAVPPARGQFFRQRTLPVYSPGVNPFQPFYNPVSPLQRVAPGVTSQQVLTNYGLALQALASGPPWLYGYNPYPSPIYSPGLAYAAPYSLGYGAYPYGAYAGAAGGYAANLYGSGYGGPYGAAGIVSPSNPYAPSPGYGSGYGGSAIPYAGDPYAGTLRGTADVMRAYGGLLIDQERANLMREAVLQAKLQTRKDRLATEKYIAANTPSFTEVQAKEVAGVLKRIQTQATPGEVETGKALNLLLQDLSKLDQQKRDAAFSTPLEEGVLGHVNVTGPAGGNLGLLRDAGRLRWPAALVGLAPQQTRADIDNLAQGLYRLAAADKLPPDLVDDLEVRVEDLQAALRRKVNEVPTGQYLQAKHFLGDLRDAVTALRGGVAVPAADFRRFVRGGKTAQQVAEYMLRRGLVFAPAVGGDEASYNAVHIALASYDVAVNAQAPRAR